MRNKIITHAAAALLALLAGSTGRAQPYSNAVTALNPVGYWPLNETVQPPFGAYIATNLGTAGAAANGFYQTWFQKYTSGTNVLYYQTNNIVHVAGAIGDGDTALSCTRSAAGAGQYVVFPRTTHGVANPVLTLTPPFSVEFWVKPNSVTSAVMPIVNEGREPVLDPRNGYTTANEDGFSIGQFGTIFFFAVWNGTGLDATKQELDVNIITNAWQHMVVTFDGRVQSWYQNGVFAKSRTIPATYVNAFGESFMPDVTTPLLIGTGSDVSAGNGASEYSGSIDEVAIYTNLLDPTAIANHYAAATATDATYKNTIISDNPIIYVRLGEPSFPASSYPDPTTYPVARNFGSAGAAGNGVYQPGTAPGVPGPGFAGFGGSHAVAINGYSGAVDVGAGYVPSSLNPTGTTALSLTAWFQGNPADAPARFQTIASHGNAGPRLAMDNVAGGPRWNPGNNPEVQFVSPSDVLTNNALINDGAWHFIAGVSDGSNATLYVDGIPVRTNTGVGSIAGANYDFLLGGDPDNLTPSYNTGNTIRYFDGQIAQVAFFTNALTAAQIQQLYGAAGVPPSVVSQPAATVSANSGQVVSIPITVKGSPPLAYQWYRTNGVAVSGQTTAALTFNPVSLANIGSYYAVVSNANGRATSSVVAVSVTGPPVVTQQSPPDEKVFTGTAPTLRVVASGPQPISYQWTRDGSPISGATASSYAPSTAATGAHTYTCVITNLYSANAGSPFTPITLTVLARPSAPYPVTVLNDHPADYFRLNEAPDNGSGNGGVPAYDYAGGLNAFYTNCNIAQPNSSYDSQFSPQTDPTDTGATFGSYASQDSYAGNGSSFLNFATPNGSNAEFSIEAWAYGASGQAPGAGVVTLGYGNGGEQFNLDTGAAGGKWRFFVRNAAGNAILANGTNAPNDGLWHHVVGVCDEANGHLFLYVDGQQTASASIPANSGILNSTNSMSIGARQSGFGTPYDLQFIGNIDEVAVYNYALSATQVVAHYVSAGVPPIIVQQPSNITTNEGSRATLSVTAMGTAPLAYQWYDNNSQPIPTGTSATLILPNLQQSQAGNYYVTVSNAYSATPVQSQSVFLSVNSGAPSLTTDLQPPFFIGYANRQFTYTVGAQGTEPFTYTWTRNGTTIPGASSSSYTFTTLTGTNLYAVNVKNAQNPSGISSSTVTNVGLPAPTLNPSNYNYRAKITFSGYNRGEALANFPALVRFGTNFPGFSYSQMSSATGGDLRFTDANGTNELPHEVDEWIPGGTSSVWVQVPILSSNNIAIWAYWGDPAATTPEAWSTNGTVWAPPFGSTQPYEVVYHLKESALPFADSTEQHPATNGVAPAQVAGIIGTGGHFDGTAWLDEGSNNLGDSFTLSAWVDVDPADPSGYPNAIQPIWANQHGGFGMPGFAFDVNAFQAYNGIIDVTSGIGNSTGSEAKTAAGAVSYSQWHLLTAALSQTNGALALYVDGQPTPVTSGFLQTGFTNYADVNLGRFTDGSFTMHGILDEARIRSGISSPNWVWAEYMNVAQNSAFETYGPAVTSLVTINAQLIGGKLVLTWPSGTLLQAPTVNGPWTTNNVSSPYTNSISLPQQYYRVIVR